MPSWIEPLGDTASRITVPYLRPPSESWQVNSDAPFVASRRYALGLVGGEVSSDWTFETVWPVALRPQADQFVAMLKTAAESADARLLVNIAAPHGSTAGDILFVGETHQISQQFTAGSSTVTMTLIRVDGEVGPLAHTRTVADSVGVVDAAQATTPARTVTDSVGITDAVDQSTSGAGTHARTIADPVGVTDATPTQSAAYTRTVTDPVGVVDTMVVGEPPIERTVTDPIGVVDGESSQTVAATETVTDPVGIGEAAPTREVDYTVDGVDSVGVTDAIAQTSGSGGDGFGQQSFGDSAFGG